MATGVALHHWAKIGNTAVIWCDGGRAGSGSTAGSTFSSVCFRPPCHPALQPSRAAAVRRVVAPDFADQHGSGPPSLAAARGRLYLAEQVFWPAVYASSSPVADVQQ